MRRSPSDFQPSAFARRLYAHMYAWRARYDGVRSLQWRRWTDGIYPAYRRLAEMVRHADAVKLHSHASFLPSSQVFAFNLFLPFREGRRARLSQLVSGAVGARLTVDQVSFEWVPPGGLLGEIAGERPAGREPATAADVVLWGRLPRRRRAAVLLEVKLSEGAFTHCNGRTSPGNQRTDVCASANRFFADPNACYLRRTKRATRDRRYWDIFSRSHGSVRAAFPHADPDGPCPFAFDMQQPMRNLAIARGIEQARTVRQAWFALCAHDDNPDVRAHWAQWARLLPDPSMAPRLPASEVVAAGEAEGLTDWAAYMRARYRL